MTGRRTVLVTGASSGIGRAAVERFAERGWNVAATLRDPSASPEPSGGPAVAAIALDVTSPTSIEAAVERTLETFGRLDAVVNNAGIGAFGLFEETSDDAIRALFETNFFGALAVLRATLPALRASRRGVVVQVSSVSGGPATLPLFSTYVASKRALEGFSEAFAHEARAVGVRVKVVRPGTTRSSFGDSLSKARDREIEAYAGYRRRKARKLRHLDRLGDPHSPIARWIATSPERVARTIVRAAEDRSARLRYTVGLDARAFTLLDRLLPDRLFRFLLGRI